MSKKEERKVFFGNNKIYVLFVVLSASGISPAIKTALKVTLNGLLKGNFPDAITSPSISEYYLK